MTARYPAPDLNTLPEDIKAKVLEVQEKAGFIPNVFLGFARRPAEWRAFFAYHDALMDPESAGRTSHLTKGDREMIVTTTSAANQCLYCVVAHASHEGLVESTVFHELFPLGRGAHFLHQVDVKSSVLRLHAR